MKYSFEIGQNVIWKEHQWERTGEVFAYGAPDDLLIVTWDNSYAEIVTVPKKRLIRQQQARLEGI